VPQSPLERDGKGVRAIPPQPALSSMAGIYTGTPLPPWETEVVGDAAHWAGEFPTLG